MNAREYARAVAEEYAVRKGLNPEEMEELSELFETVAQGIDREVIWDE